MLRTFSDDNEELRAGAPSPTVGHGNHADLVDEVLGGGELVIDDIAGPTGPVGRRVATQDHKVGGDAVDCLTVVETFTG